MGTNSDNPYLTRGIIAYIGNKRRLLNLIGGALDHAVGEDRAGLHFVDLFSGSGIVSRFARFQGMRVSANDWEPYARVLSRAWLEPVPSDIVRLFGTDNGLSTALSRLMRAEEPDVESQYLARYYAPSSLNPDDADYKTERLFYTRKNALILDAARNALDSLYPENSGDNDNDLRRCLLMAPIIYAAATRVNTSGVFKAFHKGFGGHGADALGRIMSPVTLEAPIIIDAPPGKVFSMDANQLAVHPHLSDADIVYLDPPYNQHQYGSNYHLLNSIVLWDKIPEPAELGEDGRLLRKAAIRPDWVRTRSAYCSRKTAEAAFTQLLCELKAPVVLMSYSTDGIIPFDVLRKISESYGRVRLMANPYVTYRGGRQSAGRKDRNLEFLLIIEKGKQTTAHDRSNVDRLLILRNLQLLSREYFRPELLKETGQIEDDVWIPYINSAPRIATRSLVKLLDMPSFAELSLSEATELVSLLQKARCRSRYEEVRVLEEAWMAAPEKSTLLVKEIPRLLRKLAHRKYSSQFHQCVASIRRAGEHDPVGFSLISDEIDRIEELARIRFAG